MVQATVGKRVRVRNFVKRNHNVICNAACVVVKRANVDGTKTHTVSIWFKPVNKRAHLVICPPLNMKVRVYNLFVDFRFFKHILPLVGASKARPP
jgi:hypothetical protein